MYKYNVKSIPSPSPPPTPTPQQSFNTSHVLMGHILFYSHDYPHFIAVNKIILLNPQCNFIHRSPNYYLGIVQEADLVMSLLTRTC